MSFIAAFHSFALTITNVEAGIYAEHRVKTPRHESESLESLYARMLAYCHAYREGLRFEYQGFALPLLAARNSLGELTDWIYVGCPEVRVLAAVLREPLLERAAVYLESDEEIEQLCRSLRGSMENWIKRVSFYLVDQKLVNALTEHPSTSTTWTCSLVDGSLYLTVDGNEFVGSLPAIDLWARFEATTHARPLS